MSDAPSTDAIGGFALRALESNAAEESLRLLLESVQDYAIFVLDPRGRVASWNRGAERIKGYTADEIVGQHFSRFYPDEDVRAGKCERELEIAARVGRLEDENWRVRKDGERFWANVVITALRSADQRLVGFAKITRDLSERRLAEEERVRLAEQTSAREAAEEAVDRLARLQALTGALAAAQTPEELASTLVRKGVEAFSAAYGVLVRPNRAGTLGWVAAEGVRPEVLQTLRTFPATASLPTARAFHSGAAVWLESRAELSALYPQLETQVGRRIGALVALPLQFAGRTQGALALGFDAPREFPSAERSMMATFAAQAAQALDRADLHAREVAARQRLEALGELAEKLQAASSTEEVAATTIESGMRLAAADTCTLYRLDERSDAMELVAERGCNPGVLDYIRRIERGSRNFAYVSAMNRKAVWVEDRERYLQLFPEVAGLKLEGPRAQAFWSLPLVAEDRVIGMLAMGFYAPRLFEPEERDFVETVTRHCAQALLRGQRLEGERAARALAERLQASLVTTLRSIGDGVIAADPRGRITLLNAVAEKLTGFSEREALGRPLSEVFRVVNERTREAVQNPADKVLEGSSPAALANHTILIGRDGGETQIEESGAPIRGADGAIEGVVLVFRDVGERRRQQEHQEFLAEAASVLAESLDYRETLKQVAELAVPALADWCAVHVLEDGAAGSLHRLTVAHVDPSKVELARQLESRYPPDPRANRGAPAVIRSGKPELYPDLSDEILASFARGEEHLNILRSLKPRSAMIVPLISRGSAVGAMSFVFADSRRRYGEHDLRFAEELARRCATAIDNARLYAAEQRARKSADVANRAKDEFLATVSHELRTPLNAILGWAKLSRSGGLDESKRARAIETIERNAVVMAQLIEDLLDVSRIISGKMRLSLQTVDAARIVEAAIESVRPSAEARGVAILSQAPASAELVRGDPTRLQQVVWNLLSNAVKFTPRDGRVVVVVRRIASVLEIAVTDTGKGIDPRFLPYIFDPFRQEDGTTTRARGGLGLGLAITRQLVELHGGTIEAHSEGEGRGASFFVHLPITAVVPRTETPHPGEVRRISTDSTFERPPQLVGLRVLAVDDEEDARLLVKAVLEVCGSSVTSAASVAEAMERLEQDVPDVLISDIGMPSADGYELIRRVRQLPAERGGAIPAVALTAFARGEDRRRALTAGYSMHVPKPVEPAELVSVVASLVRLGPRER